ncbi:hypothetical protein HPB49_007598 [Dermacentor silvarum]|uniref:Uncharacterized protein n=1 Tax=Dermacentor silvarum TaxID=543639 RepID=A0ACB8DBP8_DERSI|nr:hypothetical protein HPB49_007598 [Dermacentor silvarum]
MFQHPWVQVGREFSCFDNINVRLFKGRHSLALYEPLTFEGQELHDPLDADVVRFSFSSGCKNIPPVSAADIFVYLVEGVCFYTKVQFKNFKLSDAYNSFVNGKVKRVSSFKAGKRGEGVVRIVASVEASQTLSKTYQSWCVLTFEGQELHDPLDADVVRFSFSSGCKNIPPVSAADIFVYLVEGVCFYTKVQFKNFKLSDAYNSFVNGKVKRVSSFKAGKRGEGVVRIVASVEASQTLSKTYQSWCVVRDDGAVHNWVNAL